MIFVFLSLLFEVLAVRRNVGFGFLVKVVFFYGFVFNVPENISVRFGERSNLMLY